MPKKKKKTVAAKPTRATTKLRVSKPISKRTPAKAPTAAVFDRTDLRRMVLELAVQVAPTDIEYALANGDAILARATNQGSHLNPRQIQLALDLVSNYLEGECPQIPLHTVALLTAALQYLGDQIDLVPDFLPEVGDLDDAAVFAVAMSMARPGVLRYCAATGRRVNERNLHE